MPELPLDISRPSTEQNVLFWCPWPSPPMTVAHRSSTQSTKESESDTSKKDFQGNLSHLPHTSVLP
ncbi:unnamed protein product, partial [Ixodes pacificus]